MRPGRFSLLPLCLAVLLTWVVPAVAQTNTGDISGVVRDAQGGVLPGVTIVAEHLESGTSVTRVTDTEGRYLLPSLRVGNYTIVTELSGFKRLVREGITLRLGQQLQLDLSLEIGGLTEEVTVVAEAPLR